MKYIFLSAFGLMILLSAVAWVILPVPVDHRVRRLEFFLDTADSDQDGQVAAAELHRLFATLDHDADGVMTQKEIPRPLRTDELSRRVTFMLDEIDDDGDDRVTAGELDMSFAYLDRNHDAVLSAADVPTAPPVELVWCSDDNPVRREQIRLFNRYHPDYHLRLDPQNAGMEKVIVQSLAGVGPDLFDCYFGHQLSAYARSGIPLDITDRMNDAGLPADEVWQSLTPLILHEGRRFGSINNAGSQAVWYNKKVFDEEGVPYPSKDWTWDDCIAISHRLTRKNDRGQITRYGLIGYWDWKLGLYQHNVDFFTPEGTRCILDSPEAAAGMQFMQDLVYKHAVMPTPQAEAAMASAGGWGTGVIALFGAERSAMAIGGRWWLCILRDKDYAHLDLGCVEIPALRLPDGSLSNRIYGYGRSTQVNATGRNIEGAMLFVRFLHSREWSDLINRQADALGPVIRHNYTDEFLLNPEHPEEDYNEVWRTAMENTVAEQVSPFVNGQTVDRILRVQTELVRAEQKSGADAMRDAARKINEEIVDTLTRDPELSHKYQQALAAGARPAWDRPEDAPWEEGP